MALRLKPIDDTFYDLLSASAAKLVEGANLLARMLGDDPDRLEIAKKMADLEAESDELTHSIVKRVNKTFVTPLDREDIYALAAELDDVMDNMEKAVDLVILYDVRELPARFASQVDVLQRCAEVTEERMPSLRSLKDLQSYWVEINRLENAGDKAYRKIVAELLSGSYKALQAMKLRDIADALEAAINSFESVARIVEQIHVKEK